MKNLAVLALLIMASTSAVKLRKMHGSGEIDPDDLELTDGPLKNDVDVAIYQQTFVNEGANVKQLNTEAEQAKKAKLKASIEDEENRDNLLSTKPAPKTAATQKQPEPISVVSKKSESNAAVPAPVAFSQQKNNE